MCPPPALLPRPLRLRLTCLLLAAATPASAQTSSRSPDADWLELQSLLTRPANAATALARTPAGRAAARLDQIERLRLAAEQARTFRERHAGHPLAERAHRLEVMSRLDHARLDARPAATTEALEQAGAFRRDPGRLREQRFEVALAAERLRLEGGAAGRRPGADEQLAAILLREFGPAPEVLGLFAGLAGRADMAAANRLATQLLELRPPPALRAAAEAITSRHGLLGHPLGLRLTRLDGSRLELPTASPSGGPTVLYVWTPVAGSAVAPFVPLHSLRRLLPSGVTWVFLGLGASLEQARAASS
ncbi:MAG TPA: hypothetical protein DIT64_06615, partial [Verrucomicrobiales bacterium]|nr:hypothetical protein [Verrucomicrobiales bacterium]